MSTGDKGGRTAAVTGASSGFGSRLAQALAGSGFDVLACGRDRSRLEALRASIEATTAQRCEILAADLRTAETYDELSRALRACDADIVINNAAINPELTARRGLDSPSEIADVIATNLSAAIAVCSRAFAHLSERGRGVIVNVNSIAGLRGSSHEPIYAASKFGLRGFSESVKEAWLARGVRIVDVYPGAIGTGVSAGRPDVADLIDPGELAEFVVRLCSPHSFFIREINIQKTPIAARPRKKVVFANGVFDILHTGHLALLKYAKSIGDRLIVGINSDRAVRLLKGPTRPVNDELTRKAVLESIRFVDEVVVFDAERTTEIVKKLMPDIIVKGDEYTPDQVRSTDKIPESIKIITVPVVRNADGVQISTTAAIAKMSKGR